MLASSWAAKLIGKGGVMGLAMTLIVLSFVVIVLLVVAYALLEMSPFGRHTDHFRDPATGKRRWEPPNLEDGHY
jgi:uncharacterized membrane protein